MRSTSFAGVALSLLSGCSEYGFKSDETVAIPTDGGVTLTTGPGTATGTNPTGGTTGGATGGPTGSTTGTPTGSSTGTTTGSTTGSTTGTTTTLTTAPTTSGTTLTTTLTTTVTTPTTPTITTPTYTYTTTTPTLTTPTLTTPTTPTTTAPGGIPCALGGISVLMNPGFEAGQLSPWTTSGVGSVDPTAALYDAYGARTEGNYNIEQVFPGVPGNQIIQMTYWTWHYGLDAPLQSVEWGYSDGTSASDLLFASDLYGWIQWDLLPLLDTGKNLTWIRIWGYSGGLTYADVAYYDNVEICRL